MGILCSGTSLALTCSKIEAERIKDKISEFLQIHRKMQLDEKKTKITRTTKGYKFLGFQIRFNITNPRQKFVLRKNPTDGKFTRTLRRTTSRQTTIEPDSDRILKRLRSLKFCNNNYEARAKPTWLVYDEFQIVQKYARIFRGIFNYYAPCGRLTRLNRISYILQYSCARTLARRKKMCMKKIFGKYGTNFLITKKIKGTKNETTRKVEFLNLTALRKTIPKNTRFEPMVDYDPFRIHEHWRTKMKVYNECCICGEIDSVALHHLNSLSNLGKTKDKLENIRSQINRVQIPVCKKCHEDITFGKYNNPKTPMMFFNEFLAKL